MNKLPIPIEGSCRAEYEDGYIHDETALHDIGRFKNVLNDIIEGYPEKEHGRLVKFSVFYKNASYDFDWTQLPDSSRPVRFKHMELDEKGGAIIATRLMGVDIGFQYNDELGKNVKQIQELR